MTITITIFCVALVFPYPVCMNPFICWHTISTVLKKISSNTKAFSLFSVPPIYRFYRFFLLVVVSVPSQKAIGLNDSKFGWINLMVDKAKATRTRRIVEEFVYCLFRGEKMMPVLHYFPPSPPCRAVLILGRMLNIEFDLRVVNIMEGDQLKPEFLEVSMRASLIEEKNLN